MPLGSVPPFFWITQAYPGLKVKMTSPVAALIVSLAFVSLTSVEATGYSQGNIITWVDPKVSSLLGVMWRYKNYGCNCGTGRNGKPLDQVDCCCQAHNECFKTLVADGTCHSDPFDQSYSFKKVKENGKPTIHCTSADRCGLEVCRCDTIVAECFAANGAHYTSKHKNFRYASCDTTHTKTDTCQHGREL